MDCIVQGVAESQTGLSDFHFSRLKVLRSIGLRINIPSLERVEKCIHFLFVFFYLLVFHYSISEIFLLHHFQFVFLYLLDSSVFPFCTWVPLHDNALC